MLSKPGTTTFNEIMEQAASWKTVLETLEERREELTGWLRSEKFGQVVLIGCGASYCAALSAARVFHTISGLNAFAIPASEILYASRPPYDIRIKTLLIAISRSGATSETVWATEKLKKMDTRLRALAVVCTHNAELKPLCDQTLALRMAYEETVVATSSFTSSLIALQMLAAWIGGNATLPAELARLPELFEVRKYQLEIQRAVALKSQHITFLGGGAAYGIAAYNALAVREMASVSSDFMHLMEFRHGSHSAVGPGTLIVSYLSDTMRKAEEELIREVAVMRGPRLIVCSEADQRTKMGSEVVLELGQAVSEMPRICLAAPLAQILAFYLAINRGVNPDRPKHVQPVVKLKEKPAI